MKKIVLVLILILGAFLITSGCTPSISEAKFKDDYINYNENAIINFRINNPSEISFDWEVDIRATKGSGFFNCFEAETINGTVLPKKSYNGDLELITYNNENCKDYDFDVYFTLKDGNSNKVLTQKKLLLRIKN